MLDVVSLNSARALFPGIVEVVLQDGFNFLVRDPMPGLRKPASLLGQSVCVFVPVDITVSWDPLQFQCCLLAEEPQFLPDGLQHQVTLLALEALEKGSAVSQDNCV